MKQELMKLKIMLPFEVLATIDRVQSLVVETSDGSLGLLPHRLDCTAVLVPGILSYQVAGKERYAGIDTGVLVKAGREVLVCARNGLMGSDLEALRAEVKNHFLRLDEQERTMRTALARIERGFVRRFREVQHGF